MHSTTPPRPQSKILKLQTLLPLFLIPVLCGFFFRPPTWQEIDKSIAEKYPEVKEMTAETLLARLHGPDAPVIYDVRDREEYAVSHLPGAILMPDSARVAVSSDTEIVVYCSVGLRSAAFAAKLMKKGFRQVYNLKGSIFAWANKGYPLVRGKGEKVRTVHPYNRRWGTLLNKDLHQYSAQ